MTDLRDLPPGWAWSTVAEVGDVQLGRQRAPKYHTGPNMRPYLRVANVFEDRIDTSDVMAMNFEPEEFERYRLVPGDILLNEGQSPELLGRPAMYRGTPADVAFTNSLIRFRPHAGVAAEWALTVFRYYMWCGRFTRESRITTNIAHLSANRFKTVEFPVPPLAEQRRITAALAEHLSSADASAVDLASLDAQLVRLEDVVLYDTLLGMLPSDTAGPGPVRRPRVLASSPAASSFTLPSLPTGWAWMSLGDLLSRIEAGKSPRCEPRPAAAHQHGVIKVSAMTYGQFDALENKALLPGAQVDPRHEIRGGDLLVSRANTSAYVGAAVIVPENVRPGLLLSDKSLRLVPAHDVNAQWLMYALRSRHARQQIERAATGTKESMRNISQEKLRAIRLATPPPAQQTQIVSELQRRLSITQAARQSLGTMRQRVQLLRRSLLRAAVTGQLVGQNPEEESSELLLERISAALTTAPSVRPRGARTVSPAREDAGITLVEESA